MADDETRPAADAPKPDQAPFAAHPPTFQITADEPSPHEGDPITDYATSRLDEPAVAGDELPPTESDFRASEPTMESAGADLAGPDHSPDPVASPRVPEPVEPKRSIMPALLATIGLVLIALLGVNLYMMASSPERDEVPALQAELGTLKQRVASLESKPSAATDLGPLDTRVKTLDTTVSQLTSSLDETRGKVAAVPAAMQAQAQALADASAGKLDALDKRTRSVEGGVSALQAIIAALPKIDLGPLQAKVGDLQGEVDTVKAGLAAVPKIDLTPIETKLGSLEARLKPLESEYALTRTRAAPLALAAQSIHQALDDGRPFGPEIAALQSLGVDDATLSALRPLAGTGGPTRADLVAGFAAVHRAVVDADAPQPTGTVLDRMVASAQSVVKVRATGASPGNDSDAVASRITADVERGAFAAALAEWNGLPAAGKAASSTWADKLKQRVAADEATQAIASAAMATLGPPQ